MRKPIKLLTLDTETRGLFGEIFRVGVYDGFNYYCGNTFSDVEHAFSDEYENHVYIHNLDFDLSKLAPDIFSRGGIRFGDSVIINGNAVTITTDFMVMHDSYRLLTSSLEKLCKDFHVEHGKMDLSAELKKHGFKDKGEYFEKVPAEDPVLNEYLRLDCVSLYEILIKLTDLAGIDVETLVRCPTTPSLAMKVYSSMFQEDYKKATSTNYYGVWGEFLETYTRAGYYGGRTEVFTPYLKDGFHYDVNSLYPYVMKTYLYPIGEPQFYEDADAVRMWDFWRRRGIGAGFMRCDINIPDMFIPPLPYRGLGKLLFPVGKVSGVWTFPEIKQAVKMGCTIEKIYSCLYFRKTSSIFKNYILKFEELKVNSTGALRNFAKMMLNTLYGKFGMRRERQTFLDVSDLEKLTPEEREELPIFYHKYSRFVSDIEFVETLSRSNAKYIQPHIAAYVTSYARLTLLDGLLKQQEKGTVAYSDTDSIACAAEMDNSMIHDTEFGKWALEGTIKEGIFIQPKLYAEKLSDDTVNIKAKGVPSEIRKEKMTWEFYEYLLETLKEGEKEEEEIYSNYKARQKFFTMLKNDEDLETPVFLRKTINLKAEQKRQMYYKENTSKPHEIKEFGGVPEKLRKKKDFEPINFDVNFIDEDMKKFGKIKPLKEDSVYYLLYTTIPEKYIHLYFDTKGIELKDWCKQTGWNAADLLYEIGGGNK